MSLHRTRKRGAVSLVIGQAHGTLLTDKPYDLVLSCLHLLVFEAFYEKLYLMSSHTTSNTRQTISCVRQILV